MSKKNDQIRADWINILSLHLHRFLTPWLQSNDVDVLWVTTGHRTHPGDQITFRVSMSDAEWVENPAWDFCALYDATVAGERETKIGETGELRCALPVPGVDNAPLAFVLLPGFGLVETGSSLVETVFTALRTARRNAIRLFFDESKKFELRNTVLELFDHLKLWFGAEEAALFLADSTATATHRGDNAFRIVAHESDAQRWTGISPQPGDFDWFDAYVAQEQNGQVVSLMTTEWDGTRRLGGLFMDVEIDEPTLGELLSRYVSQSPYFTLGLEKLQVLSEINEMTTLSEIVAHLTKSTGVPAISIGVLEGSTLHFRNATGWTEYETVSLDLNESRGVAALAARLAKPVTLVGGTGPDSEFQNHVFVHEPTRRIDDKRRPTATLTDDWKPLAEYYEPAMRGAYATIAYPTLHRGVLKGVLALELDHSTGWYWWNGLASRLFWDAVSDAIADLITHG